MGVTSQPAVIDYLLATFRGLPICNVPSAPVIVFDGFPGPNIPYTFVAVGGSSTPTANGVQSWAQMGAYSRDESYMVEVVIAGFVGGSSDSQNPADFSDAQKAARDQAFAIFNAFHAAIRGSLAKVTFGALANIAAELTDIAVEQTDDADPTSLKGRRCTIVFYVHVLNRI